MENASKALIIAGAILLSILIIALGMNVYNSASSSAEGADLSSQEVSAFNSTFESYEGSQKGRVVRSLITSIKSNNTKNADTQINLTGINDAGAITSNKTYNVRFTYDDNQGGLITECEITDPTATP